MIHEKDFPGEAANQAGDEIQSWWDWFNNNLDRQDKATALIRALVDCDARDRLPFLEILHDALRAGPPVAPFDSVMAEAALWADWASRAERKAYLVACWRRLARNDQKAFLEYAAGAA
ncbi:hypothetical protein [Paracoccus spongiarum]|uniref:Uncharacterized protein n=1 Tax=Paracoccus spongiarum TaxID=3064387 RepID=A0ABT9JHE4_9RHOB|nr:hypothetical protein [Paracoccus sp. 2205BS29-5]MDP5309140.1 hypothetical protein [Paracoccus sp. 2205BS29-5]